MITIIYSTHKDKDYNNKFKQHLLQNVGVKDVEILEFENFNQGILSVVFITILNSVKIGVRTF